ncbi:MAG: hypothetical protein NT139_01815 [Candidatus Woesearchaeota archaeon]|nr:hypothetical protein [Candidatus Woesearchaeota archaeon]
MKNNIKFRIAVIMFLVLLAILIPKLIYAQEEPSDTIKVSFHYLGQNISTEIDLKRFFAATKLEKIYYDYEPNDNIIISIDQDTGVATLLPKPGFKGTEIVTFKAKNAETMKTNRTRSQFEEGTKKSGFEEFKKNILKNLKLDPILKRVDDFLDIIDQKTSGILLPIRASLKKDNLEVNIANQVFLRFNKNGTNPQFSIKINTLTVPLNETLTATCSDGVQNQDEKGVDCGGPCETQCTNEEPKNIETPKKDYLPIIFFTLLIVLVIIALTVLSIKSEKIKSIFKEKFRFKKYKVSKSVNIKDIPQVSEGKIDLKKLFGIELIQRIDYLDTIKSKMSNKELIKELSKIMKYFLGKFFNIRYQFTLDELRNELDGIKIKNKEGIILLLEDLSEIEYSPKEPEIKTVLDLTQRSKNIIGELSNLTPIKIKEIKPMTPIKVKEHYITPHIKEPKILQQKEFEENFHKQVSSIYQHIKEKNYDQALTRYQQLHKKKN